MTVTSPEQWSDLLRQSGLRVTGGRLATLGYVEQHPHSSVGEIHAALSPELDSLSQQSVHNITHDLTERGLLRRIDPPDSDSSLYETRTEDNHHHVQCVVCRRIEDVDCATGAAPCLTPSHTHKMRIFEASVTFRGICNECDIASTEHNNTTQHGNAQRRPTQPNSAQPSSVPHSATLAG